MLLIIYMYIMHVCLNHNHVQQNYIHHACIYVRIWDHITEGKKCKNLKHTYIHTEDICIQFYNNYDDK